MRAASAVDEASRNRPRASPSTSRPARVAGLRHPARPRPDVRGREIGEPAVELRVEERQPQPLDHAPPAGAPQPLARSGVSSRLCMPARRTGSGRRTWPSEPVVRSKERERREARAPSSSRTGGRRRRSRPSSAGSASGRAGRPCRPGPGRDRPRQDHVVEAVDPCPSRSNAPASPPSSGARSKSTDGGLRRRRGGGRR